MQRQKSVLAIVLGLLWGCIWGAYLQYTKKGQWLVNAHTWLATVIGVGGNLIIALLFIPLHLWTLLFGVFAVSSLPLIARSLTNEHRESEDFFNDLKGRI